MKYCIILTVIIPAALTCLFSGSVSIPADEVCSILLGKEATQSSWTYIVWEMRFPAMLTALFTGAGLGVAGLLLQSYFRNPLAGPSILGITSGANLAVAIVILLTGLQAGLELVGASFVGAFSVLLLLLGVSRMVRQTVTLLIVGILLSYLTSAILTLLNYQASADGVQALLLWGMGTFQQVGMNYLPLYTLLITFGLLGSLWLIRPMNGWMMGELYARNLGISISQVRWGVLLVTGLLCATTTAWCGPIAFVGLSIPHVARLLFKTDNHRTLLPASMLLGALCCLLCLWLSSMPAQGRSIPINALTPLFGIPVILYILLKRKG